MTIQVSVQAFHEIYEQPVGTMTFYPVPGEEMFDGGLEADSHRLQFRIDLIKEEVEELDEADTAIQALDALADIVYVCFGMAIEAGWDLDKAIQRVHQSNLSKLGEDGKPIYNDVGKVMKGPNYRRPQLGDLV